MAEIKRIGVVGGGQMGSGIAQIAAVNGFEVWIHDSDSEALSRAKTSISSGIQNLVSKRKLTSGEGVEAVNSITYALSLEDFCSVDIVIEAIVESEDVKKKLFFQLDGIVKSSAILASNTSSISITRLASATKRPTQVNTIVLSSPLQVM
ncbi:hypothetical protein M569_17153 [Genlisea aurea]|uniref:3-hydroxyacyl-CoA dehydrogenase NAD binding domain-containing protein n=1 Tax=Genlisea aurea TaxID=192259 RepID=S8D4Q2_9LAMI|nr:hypothetical protein M569_17153 [Genlisea aurea]